MNTTGHVLPTHHGPLAVCTRCECIGTLTSTCIGAPVQPMQARLIEEGRIDFVHGSWTHPVPDPPEPSVRGFMLQTRLRRRHALRKTAKPTAVFDDADVFDTAPS